MGQELRRGFKAEAERIAHSVREELGLPLISALKCDELCQYFGIPMISVPDLIASGASPRSVRCITAPAAKFSAMTIAVGTKRLIVYNPQHPAGRRANSLAHEISHVILEHPLSPALGIGGCRRWDSTLEDEADWQAGALLVPRQAALQWIRSGQSLEDGALHFGVSLPLFRWRVNHTGVHRQIGALANSQYSRW